MAAGTRRLGWQVDRFSLQFTVLARRSRSLVPEWRQRRSLGSTRAATPLTVEPDSALRLKILGAMAKFDLGNVTDSISDLQASDVD